MMDIICPKCGSKDTFFSAIHLAWKCVTCNNIFESSTSSPRKGDAISAPSSKNVATEEEKIKQMQKKLFLKPGEKNKKGETLLIREEIDGLYYDIWKEGKKFGLCIPKSETTGIDLGKFSSLEEAKIKLQTLKECR